MVAIPETIKNIKIKQKLNYFLLIIFNSFYEINGFLVYVLENLFFFYY